MTLTEQSFQLREVKKEAMVDLTYNDDWEYCMTVRMGMFWESGLFVPTRKEILLLDDYRAMVDGGICNDDLIECAVLSC